MKILLITPSTERGGVEEYTQKIASAAVKEGYDVHVAFPKTAETESLIQEFTASGVFYHRLEIAETTEGRLLTLRKYLPHFLRTVLLLLQVKPDLVQIVLPNPAHCFGSILACGFLQIPTVVRFGLVPYKWTFGVKELKIYNWARSRNQQWLTISENNRKLVSQSFQIPEDELALIYNGSPSISTYNNSQEDLKRLRFQIIEELGIPVTSQLALTVGRLENQKGHIDLIPVIPHITKEFPEVKFVWVGEGKQQEKLVNKVREYGIEDKVLFLGYRSDVPKLLKAANLFVFPTHYEGGQSFAIAEAMGYGVPIVTSDASGIPEIIKHGIHGLLFRTGDSCDLLETLRWALRNPEQMQQMADKGRLRAQEFSEEKMVRKTLELWQKLVGNSSQEKYINNLKIHNS